MAPRHSSTAPKAHPSLTEAFPLKSGSTPGVIGGAKPSMARVSKLSSQERLIKVPAQAPARWLLRITLEEVKPTVWREFVVSNGCTLDQLHEIVQEVMGWDNAHLHQWLTGPFAFGDVEIDDEDPNLTDEFDVRLRNLPLGLGCTFFYEYDLGDDWRHRLEILEIQPAMKGGGNPVLIKGANCCPPEDCGGPSGYQELLKAISDPEHEEHAAMLQWCGGSFDPKAFDLEGTQTDLQLLAQDQRKR